jgi:hypothetical protein
MSLKYSASRLAKVSRLLAAAVLPASFLLATAVE